MSVKAVVIVETAANFSPHPCNFKENYSELVLLSFNHQGLYTEQNGSCITFISTTIEVSKRLLND